jgi:hypothetical protein
MPKIIELLQKPYRLWLRVAWYTKPLCAEPQAHLFKQLWI